jgi:hypothetical protein
MCPFDENLHTCDLLVKYQFVGGFETVMRECDDH